MLLQCVLQQRCSPFLAERISADTDYDLNTCFAWLGYGSFVSRTKVLQTLDDISRVSTTPGSKSRSMGIFSSAATAMLDNAFTTVQNEPPYVLSGRLVPMDHSQMFSTKGEGDLRNELFIQEGLDTLLDALAVPTSVSPYPPPLSAVQVDAAGFAGTPSPLADETASWKHPYWHHSRSVSHTNDAIFLTNVASLPAPHAVEYKPHPARNLSVWEAELSSSEIWGQGKPFAELWPYQAAVDGDAKSAWRSPDSKLVAVPRCLTTSADRRSSCQQGRLHRARHAVSTRCRNSSACGPALHPRARR